MIKLTTDQEDDDNEGRGEDDGHDDDDVTTFKELVLQQDQVVRVHHLVVNVNQALLIRGLM